MTAQWIFSYFPDLTEKQQNQFVKLQDLYTSWNNQVNIISRKDIGNLYLHHVLHSLAIAKVISFLPDEKILDVGTGGGFPGIPLAILFPTANFYLIDSIGKKIKVVKEIAKELNLKNLEARQIRAEKVQDQFNFVVSRAVDQLKFFYPWIRNKFNKNSKNILSNGVFYLKGGDLTEEIKESGLKNVLQFPIVNYFSQTFFMTKSVVYFPAQ